jgi:hypothetical protein
MKHTVLTLVAFAIVAVSLSACAGGKHGGSYFTEAKPVPAVAHS